MTALMSEPGCLIAHRPVKPGDGDALATLDEGWTYNEATGQWALTQAHDTTPGRDCPACPADAEAHGEWGAPTTGCGLNRASLVIAARRPR